MVHGAAGLLGVTVLPRVAPEEELVFEDVIVLLLLMVEIFVMVLTPRLPNVSEEIVNV